ncbi:MAG: TetR/AcrR family transcriptional regulator [Chloroflexi bacterium]|nr:TetR/AcrR family transcriptional regulator [Chloroflexota bacterium]
MSDERRVRILNATRELLLHYGYDKTTVSDIAQAAGVSKGAIYLHYPSKDALVEALLWHDADRAQQEIARRLQADPNGGSFTSLYVHGLRVAMEMPLLRAIYGNRQSVFGDVFKRLAPNFSNQAIRAAAIEFIRKYQALGLIRADIDAPKVVAYMLAYMRYGLLTIEDVIPSDEAPPLDAVLDLLVDVLDRGFAASAATPLPAGQRTSHTPRMRSTRCGRSESTKVEEEEDHE